MKDQRRYLFAAMILVLLTVLLIPIPVVLRADEGETPPFERTEPAGVAAAAKAPSSDDAHTAAAVVPPPIDRGTATCTLWKVYTRQGYRRLGLLSATR